jgi:formylglycine-generating enzyme
MARIHQENKKAIMAYCKKEEIMNFHNKITVSLSMVTLLLTGCSVAQVAGPIEQASDPITGMEFVAIPGGCFQMGDLFGEGANDERSVHEVCVDGFFMGKYEVTQSEWEKVMGNNPSEFQKGPRYPVEQVSWDVVQDFIKKLNSQSGKQYRLPTEAEWEYAAREGGKKVRFGHGKNTIDRTEANFREWSLKDTTYDDLVLSERYRQESTVSVGTFQPNSLGLYDMSGNVLEFCSDWYRNEEYYRNSPRQNPQGPSTGTDHVFRGGAYLGSKDDLRVTQRFAGATPTTPFLGFRLVFSSSATNSKQ